MPKKTHGRGVAYTTAKKRYLVMNIGLVKPVSKGDWERVHNMHLSVYGYKNQTVESLRWCYCFCQY
eukprot:6532731-Ditylum_brightwellii.AAC.1